MMKVTALVMGVALGAVLGAWRMSASAQAQAPAGPVGIQTLLNQGYEVKAAGRSCVNCGGTLYLQKAEILYGCAMGLSGPVTCNRVR